MSQSEKKPLILVVDDTEDARYALEKLLKHNGYDAMGATGGEEGIQFARMHNPALILLDVMMPLVDGYETARRIKVDPVLKFTPVILLTARDSLEDIVKGLDSGGDDYLVKPFKTDELLARVRAALRLREVYEELRETTEINHNLQELVSKTYDFKNIIGQSEPMKKVFDLLKKVSQAESPILITGPSGTGKELIARAIHFNSPRKSENFIARNCAAFNENLLESELFGHVRGSFTGAIKDQKGVFEQADKGTLFLDEVGEMTQALQAKLLRVLQEGIINPVGGSAEKKVKVRVLTATHRDLPKMIEEGKFREDLYYRLNVINVDLPPLKDRKGDIPLLVQYFLDKAAKKQGGPVRKISSGAMKALEAYSWRGNIRELENEVERALIIAEEGEVLDVDCFSSRVISNTSIPGTSTTAGSSLAEAGLKTISLMTPGKVSPLKDILESVEKEQIKNALTTFHWNRSQTAKALGVSRSNLLSKIESFQLQPPAEIGGISEDEE
jgi:DNA-binding NtrC family response regulator